MMLLLKRPFQGLPDRLIKIKAIARQPPKVFAL
jgi:hypothetical protein